MKTQNQIIQEAYIGMVSEATKHNFDKLLHDRDWYHQMTVNGNDRQYYNVNTVKPKPNEIIHVQSNGINWSHKKHNKEIKSGEGMDTLNQHLNKIK